MFNESQIEAISHHLGPALILAGPGSGKTTVITHRVKSLITNHHIPPEKILVVTFTKAAAVNMQQRFQEILKEEKSMKYQEYPVTFGTFHSIYFKILRLSYNYSGNDVISEIEKVDIINEITVRLKIDVPSRKEFVYNIVSEISNVKGNMLNPEEFHSLHCNREDFIKLFREYEKELKALSKMDFDDLLVKCYGLLQSNKAVLKKWQDIYKYILIDEFQDINRIQYEIIKMIAQPENNIFVVGDDDQSIYGFRGAKPEIMFDFKNDYPAIKEVLLNINYRCSHKISEWASNVISHNKNRFHKEIIAFNKKSKFTSEIKEFKNQGEEIEYVIKQIKDYLNKGLEIKDIAILVRNNSQVSTINKILSMHSLGNSSRRNYYMYKGEVAEDILSYVRAAINYDKLPICENEDLIRIINKPNRLISRQILGQEGITIKQLKEIYKGTNIEKNIDKLIFDLGIIKMSKPFGAVAYIRNGIGYDEYLEEYAVKKQEKSSFFIKQLDRIHQDASHYNSFKKWLKTTIRDEEASKDTGVNVMTMHGSKGLEYKVVFILEANQGIIPSSKAVREDDFEEERRLFYVAMTRASLALHIYGIKEILGCRAQMSMFVSELLKLNEN